MPQYHKIAVQHRPLAGQASQLSTPDIIYSIFLDWRSTSVFCLKKVLTNAPPPERENIRPTTASWPGWALSSTFARLIHVDVKVFRELALVWRRWVRIPRLLSDHHFHAVTTDHLTMHQVNRATSRLSTVVLHVTVLPACSAQQSTSMSHLSQQQSASTHTVDFESAGNVQSLIDVEFKFCYNPISD